LWQWRSFGQAAPLIVAGPRLLWPAGSGTDHRAVTAGQAVKEINPTNEKNLFGETKLDLRLKQVSST